VQPRAPKVGKTTLAIAAVMAVSAFVCPGVANAADRTQWATGAALQKALSQEIDILWSGNPLRQAIESLSHAQRVAVLIDRRIDPGQKLDLKLDGVPMESALQKIADRCGMGVSRLGAVVYLGPPPAAEQLRTLATEFEKNVRRLPSATQRKFSQPKLLAWEDLATPRDLLADLGRQSGLKIAGLEQVPHDLWAAADLPPISLIDRLTLIAVQFDLTFTVAADGTQVELVPVPENLPRPAGDNQRLVAPQMAPKRSAGKQPAAADRTLIKRFAVREKPLGPVLQELAKQFELELRIDQKAIRAAGISLDQRVSAKVENATVDELLRELLKSTGLTFHHRQKVVEIVPVK
jgi:hypothetical protein